MTVPNAPAVSARNRPPLPRAFWRYQPVYSVLIALVAWELSSRFALINPYFFPEPSKIAVTALDLTLTGELLTHSARDRSARAQYRGGCAARNPGRSG